MVVGVHWGGQSAPNMKRVEKKQQQQKKKKNRKMEEMGKQRKKSERKVKTTKGIFTFLLWTGRVGYTMSGSV